MKMMKKTVCIFITVCMILGTVGCEKKINDSEKPTTPTASIPTTEIEPSVTEEISSPTATNTPEPTATSTIVPTATNTPEPTATSTIVPTVTNTPEPTVTNTVAPTATNTPKPTATNTPKPTATNTPNPTATNTPKPTATNTPKPTATSTPKPTATNTPKPTATNTPKPTATSTPRPTATNTPKPTPTNTPKPTATPTPAKRDYGLGETWKTPYWELTVTKIEVHYRCNTMFDSEYEGEQVVIVHYNYKNTGKDGSGLLIYPKYMYDQNGTNGKGYPCTHQIAPGMIDIGMNTYASRAYILKNKSSSVTLTFDVRVGIETYKATYKLKVN